MENAIIRDKLLAIGEYMAAGLYETPERSLFFRKARALRRYYENCPLFEYNGELLYPLGKTPFDISIYPHYKDGFKLVMPKFEDEEPELFECIKADFQKYSSILPPKHCVAGNMFTHSMPNYERILAEGLVSYGERVKKIEDDEMREGLLDLLDGIFTYIDRCVEYLESKNADECLITALKKVPKYPAENIYEAILSWNFAMYLDNCDNLGALARCIAPYWNGEDIVPLLANLYDNLDENDGYSMSLDCSNPDLAEMCLEAARGKRRPMIEFFVDEDTPDRLWKKAFEIIRSGGGQPAFYNPHILLDGLRARFPEIRDEDIKKFCGGGCTEAMIMGLSNVGSVDAGINLPLVLEETIGKYLETSATFDEFYEQYIKESKRIVKILTAGINHNREVRAKYNPLPMRTLLVDDCIDRGVEFNNFGARYSWSVFNFGGLVNALDSLLAIRTLVYDQKKYTAEEFIRLLEEGSDEFVSELKGLELCHGKDIPEVNEFANKLSGELFSLLDNEKQYKGMGFLPASILFRAQAAAGANVGATPDGRRDREPLADSLAAIFGKDTDGPTALLGSVTSFRLDKALGVPVVNFNIQPDFSDDVLKSLIMGYMKKGGAQLQLTCMSKETLLDAYAHPENYNNLIVRVGGFSEYFNRLEDPIKKVVIDRTVQSAK